MNWNELYNYYRKTETFSALSKPEQDELIKLAMTKEIIDSWQGSKFVLNISSQLKDKKTSTFLLQNYLLHSDRPGDHIENIFRELKNIEEDKAKEALIKNGSKHCLKLLLALTKISLDEEIIGLRALSTSKSIPSIIYEMAYKPSMDAILKLPPIMRLKAIEALSSQRFIKYNIFENIPEDKFNSVLFPSALRYREKVEQMLNKYKDLKYMGTAASVKISGECDMCGKYEVIINSSIFRTFDGLKNTTVGYSITNSYCPFCRQILKNKPIFESE